MMVDQRLWKKGEFVEMVDLDRFGPLEVAIPQRWYMLRVHPNREFKVMKTFGQRNISGWLPLQTSMQDIKTYRHGYEQIRRREVTSPLISGVIIIPDFEASRDRWREIDGVIGILRMGPCMPSLTPKLLQDLRNIEAIGNTPRSKRERLFEVGQLVRVVNGPFRSFCASVERLDSRSRLKIGVEIFGRITPIEVSESDIEAV
jgi:transcription termination/antitermination protein NusG